MKTLLSEGVLRLFSVSECLPQGIGLDLPHSHPLPFHVA